MLYQCNCMVTYHVKSFFTMMSFLMGILSNIWEKFQSLINGFIDLPWWTSVFCYTMILQWFTWYIVFLSFVNYSFILFYYVFTKVNHGNSDIFSYSSLAFLSNIFGVFIILEKLLKLIWALHEHFLFVLNIMIHNYL